MNNVSLDKLQEIFAKSGDVAKSEWILQETMDLLAGANIIMTETQKLSLASHLSAMVHRSQNGGEIPPVDVALFSEISAGSLDLADEICQKLPNMAEGEKYLLSIHFESAKQIN